MNKLKGDNNTMPFKEGKIVEGTVTGVTKFGAFVDIGAEENGLVHISEISHDYVENVSDYVAKGDKVKVKILAIESDGKISLSMRGAKPQTNQPGVFGGGKNRNTRSNKSFEDKLDDFLKQSTERQDKIRQRDNSN